ncbi:hypothetical protein [Streptomyces sp. NPDC054787]
MSARRPAQAHSDWARQPVQVVVGLVFPVMMLMFSCLIGGGQVVEGDFKVYLVPGMLTMTMAFGLEATMLSVILSNAIASPASMPSWSGAIVEGNPMSAMATAVRGLFGNPGAGGDSWAATQAELLAVAWPVGLIAVFFPLAVKRFRDLSR